MLFTVWTRTMSIAEATLQEAASGLSVSSESEPGGGSGGEAIQIQPQPVTVPDCVPQERDPAACDVWAQASQNAEERDREVGIFFDHTRSLRH